MRKWARDMEARGRESPAYLIGKGGQTSLYCLSKHSDVDFWEKPNGQLLFCLTKYNSGAFFLGAKTEQQLCARDLLLMTLRCLHSIILPRFLMHSMLTAFL